MYVFCTLKIKIESQNWVHGYVKDQWPYPNQNQDAKPQSGTSSILQSSKWWLKGHVYSLHLQNRDKEPIFGWGVTKDQWIYPNQDLDAKHQLEISRVLHSPNSGIIGHGCSLHLQNLDRAKIQVMGVLNPSDHIQIKIKMPDPSQEPPVSSKAPDQEFKDMDVLCTFKI